MQFGFFLKITQPKIILTSSKKRWCKVLCGREKEEDDGDEDVAYTTNLLGDSAKLQTTNPAAKSNHDSQTHISRERAPSPYTRERTPSPSYGAVDLDDFRNKGLAVKEEKLVEEAVAFTPKSLLGLTTESAQKLSEEVKKESKEKTPPFPTQSADEQKEQKAESFAAAILRRIRANQYFLHEILFPVVGMGVSAFCITETTRIASSSQNLEDELFWLALNSYCLGVGGALTAGISEIADNAQQKLMTRYIFILAILQGLIVANLNGGWRGVPGQIFLAITSSLFSGINFARIGLNALFRSQNETPIEISNRSLQTLIEAEEKEQTDIKRFEENKTEQNVSQVEIAVADENASPLTSPTAKTKLVTRNASTNTWRDKCSFVGELIGEYLREIYVNKIAYHTLALTSIVIGGVGDNLFNGRFWLQTGSIMFGYLGVATEAMLFLAPVTKQVSHDETLNRLLPLSVSLLLPTSLSALSNIRIIVLGGVLVLVHQHETYKRDLQEKVWGLQRAKLIKMHHVLKMFFALEKHVEKLEERDKWIKTHFIKRNSWGITDQSIAFFSSFAVLLASLALYQGSSAFAFQLAMAWLGAFSGYHVSFRVRIPNSRNSFNESILRRILDYLTTRNFLPLSTLFALWVQNFFEAFYPNQIGMAENPIRDWFITPADYFFFLGLAGIYEALHRNDENRVPRGFPKEFMTSLAELESYLAKSKPAEDKYNFQEVTAEQGVSRARKVIVALPQYKLVESLMFREFEELALRALEKKLEDEKTQKVLSSERGNSAPGNLQSSSIIPFYATKSVTAPELNQLASQKLEKPEDKHAQAMPELQHRYSVPGNLQSLLPGVLFELVLTPRRKINASTAAATAAFGPDVSYALGLNRFKLS